MRDFEAISLFSGAMGLDLGFERAGRLIGHDVGKVEARFTIKACVESNDACIETILANLSCGRTRSKKMRIYTDITQITDPRSILRDFRISELPLLLGGPPCQTFSTAGRRRTIQDPKGTMLWEFVRFVKELRPRFFLIENVRGLLSAAIRHRPIAKRGTRYPPLSRDEEPGSVYHKLVRDLERMGYHTDAFEVNAVNYGAPQLRERVLIIGNKFNLTVDFPAPIFRRPITATIKYPEAKPFRTIRDAISGFKEPNPIIMDFSKRKKRYLAMIPPGGNWRFLPKRLHKESMGLACAAKGGRSGWYRRLDWDLPCPCLMSIPNHAGTSLCHPDKIRALSVDEYKRIQEFPNDWEIRGRPVERYSQLGNAVPLRLAEVAAKVIGDYLVASGRCREVTPGKRVIPSRSVYLDSQVRTRKWYVGGKPITMETRNS